MTPDEFEKWENEMLESKRASSRRELAELLGVHPNMIAYYRTHGGTRRLELACWALANGYLGD